MSTTRPRTRRLGLGAALRELERTDPDVAAAAERLDILAWKASIGWPEKRRFTPSPAPNAKEAGPS